MKRFIIYTTSILLATASLFAITEKQKTDFLNKVTGDFLAADKTRGDKHFSQVLEETYSSMASVTKPIAQWAIESPIEYKQYTTDTGYRAQAQWVVRYYIERNNLLNYATCTDEQSAGIFDHRAIYDAAAADVAVYEQLKANDFMSGGIKMADIKIADLAKIHGDIDTLEAALKQKTPVATLKKIAENFDRYFSTLMAWSSDDTLDHKVRWKKFESIELKMLPLTKEVNENGTSKYPQLVNKWAELQAAHATAKTFYDWNR